MGPFGQAPDLSVTVRCDAGPRALERDRTKIQERSCAQLVVGNNAGDRSGALMKTSLLFILFVFVCGGVCASQTDPLGPHNVNGSGCVLCHVPNRLSPEAPVSEDDSVFWGRASATPEVANGPGSLGQDQALFHTFVCVTCHDGSIASIVRLGRDPSAEQGKKYIFQPEMARFVYEHPVHVPYLPNDGCGEPSPTCNPDHWPSRVDSRGVLSWAGSDFTEEAAAIYGRPARFYPSAEHGGQAMVECSSCHNPHSFQAAHYKLQGKIQVKPSRAFVRGWYQTSGKYSDTVSQFCQSCHYGHAADSVNVRQ